MERLSSLKITSNHRDWWSKLTDGVLTAALMILVWLTVALVTRPISLVLGKPGLLIFGLALLAAAMYSLQQALVPGRQDIIRAWYGIAGGFLAWSVAEVSSYLGVPILPSLAGMLLLIMVVMIVGLLWRSVLPLGARFFSLVFLLNWTTYVLMRIQEVLAGFSPIFQLIYRATGYLAIFAIFLVLGWLLFQSRRRLQRVSAALAIWFLFTIALYVFSGSLFK
jgi:hypothetical protein